MLQVVLAAAIPSVLLILVLIVVTVIIVLGCIKWRKVHQRTDDGNEYDMVDYKPPTLPPRQLPNVAYHTGTDLNKHEGVCLKSNVAYQPIKASTSDKAEPMGDTSDYYEN